MTKMSISARAAMPRLVVAMATSSLLAGCAGFAQQARTTAREKTGEAEAAFENTVQPPKMPRVVDTDDFFVSTKAVRLRDDAELLPAMFRMPMRLQVNPRASFKDMAAQITKASGLPFSISREIEAESTAPSMNSGFAADSTLKGILDTLTAQAGLSWRYRDGTVEVYRYETRVFQLVTPPGTSESTTTISNKNSSQGAQGAEASTRTTSVNGQDYKQISKIDFWATTEAEIKQMLTPQVGKAVLSQANGSITVTDTTQVLNTVAAYVKEVNFLRSRNVAISVQVYSVESKNSESVDLKLTGIFKKLNKYGFKMVSPTSGIIENSGSVSMSVDNPNSLFNGTNMLLQVLNTIGDTAEVDKFSVVTVTGEPAPINSLTNEGYLAKVTVQQPTYNGGSPATSLEPGILTYGASGTLTPRLINGTDLQLRVALDLSTRLDIKKVSANDGGSSIQLPETASRSFANTFNIKSGETLIIGFQANQSGFNASSMANPESALSLLAGGNRSGAGSRRTLIYAITPNVTAPR